MRKLFILFLLINFSKVAGQEINITVPSHHLGSHQAFISVHDLLFSNEKDWKKISDGINHSNVINPAFKVIGEPRFIHTSEPAVSLPASVLEWRLESIGGVSPLFAKGDFWPGYKTFSTSEETWYEPGNAEKPLTPGAIRFSFKIPSQAFAQHKFLAGTYQMKITHNYSYESASPLNEVFFSPSVITINLIINEVLDWNYSPQSIVYEINNLDIFRSDLNVDLGDFHMTSSVPFRITAQLRENTLRYFSAGEIKHKKIPQLQLLSPHPDISAIALNTQQQNLMGSTTEKNLGSTDFKLLLKVPAAELKKKFFEAGDYHFQINLEAEEPGSFSSGKQVVDVHLKTLPLSEISRNEAAQVVNLDFKTSDDYKYGMKKTIPNQLKISNNENFEFHIKAGTTHFLKSGIKSEISSETLHIGVEGNSPVELSPKPQILLKGEPVLDKDLNITYEIPSEKAQNLFGKEEGAYSIEVFYYFTAQ